MKDGHGGVTVGSEISGGARNVFAENCRMTALSGHCYPHQEQRHASEAAGNIFVAT